MIDYARNSEEQSQNDVDLPRTRNEEFQSMPSSAYWLNITTLENHLEEGYRCLLIEYCEDFPIDASRRYVAEHEIEFLFQFTTTNGEWFQHFMPEMREWTNQPAEREELSPKKTKIITYAAKIMVFRSWKFVRDDFNWLPPKAKLNQWQVLCGHISALEL